MADWVQTSTENGKKGCLKRKNKVSKIRQYSEIVKEVNFDKKSKVADPVVEFKKNEMSKRDKMLEFAKSIPKIKKHAFKTLTSKPVGNGSRGDVETKEIEFLENQHQMYQQKLKNMKIN